MLQNLSLCLSLFSCGALEIPDVWASRFETVSLAEVEKMTLLRSAHSDDKQTQCSACACLSLRALECVCARKHRPACNAYACVMNASARNANAGARARFVQRVQLQFMMFSSRAFRLLCVVADTCV